MPDRRLQDLEGPARHRRQRSRRSCSEVFERLAPDAPDSAARGTLGRPPTRRRRASIAAGQAAGVRVCQRP
jgi:hypothetical protein